MSEIKRYDRTDNGDIFEIKSGDYVRYDDIKHLLENRTPSVSAETVGLKEAMRLLRQEFGEDNWRIDLVKSAITRAEAELKGTK